LRRGPGSALAASAAPEESRVAAVQDLLEHYQRDGGFESERIVRAWDMYETPEVRFACRSYSNAFSSAKFVLGRRMVVGRDPEPVLEPKTPEENKAYELLQTFAGGPEGQVELLDRIGTYFTVPGDMAMVGAYDPAHIEENQFAKWDVWSTSELRWNGQSLQIRTSATDEIWKPQPTWIKHLRVWNRHPRWGWLSDSPVLSALDVLEQIGLYDARLRADSLSRLIGAGVWFLPQGMRLPTMTGEAGGPQDFMKLMMQVARIAIKDRYSAAAAVPILAEAAIEDIEAAVKGHIDFATKYDERIGELREADIRRWATAVDLPAETVLGMAEATHWNASLISEDKVQSFIVPSLRRCVGNLTIGWLRPALRQFGLSDPSLVLWFDPSGIKTHVDLGEEAQWASDHHMIADKDTLYALGLGQMEAPENEQLKRQMLLRMAAAQPEFVPEILRELGIPNDMPDLTKRQAVQIGLDQAPSGAKGGLPGPQPGNAKDKQPAAGGPGRTAELSTKRG
jgi:hypothetical protein